MQITIDGLPVPWAAHRGYGKRSFNPRFKEKEFYQWQIKAQWNQAALTCPIKIEVVYHMPIPKGTSKVRHLEMLNGRLHHIRRPDLDNLNKFLLDTLKTICMEDDNQVCEIEARKIYGLVPKTLVKIHAIR